MATANDPLAQLERAIAEARQLPPPEPYITNGDPLARLSSALRGQPGESTKTAAIAVSDATPLESLVGREVLAMVSERPLSAEARAEAVRRLAVALQSPTQANVRSVLAVLVTGRDDA